MSAPRTSPKPCSVTDCSRNAVTRGWCSKHYERWRTTGDPAGTLPHGTKKNYHGTVNGYTNHWCRCQPCRNAWTERQLRHYTVIQTGATRPNGAALTVSAGKALYDQMAAYCDETGVPLRQLAAEAITAYLTTVGDDR